MLSSIYLRMWRVLPIVLCLTVAQTFGCRSKQLTDDGTCCQQCPPGYGVVELCNHANNTVCAPCPDSISFSPEDSHTAPCRSCRQCPLDMRVRGPCTHIEDTECECSMNLFLSTDGTCQLCKECEPGYGARYRCSSFSDTECSPCRSDFYSEYSNNQDPCMPCSTCSNDQKLVHECKPHLDTVCAETEGFSHRSTDDELIHMDYPDNPDIEEETDFPFSDVISEQPKSMPPVPEATTSTMIYVTNSTNVTTHAPDVIQSSRDIIPVYCSIMVAVVLGLVAYIVFKRWHSCKNVQGSEARGKYSVTGGGEKQQTDSGVFVDIQAQAEAQPMTKAVPAENTAVECKSWTYAALPPHAQEELEGLLESKEAAGWRELALVLGYTEEDVVAFSQAERPAQVLLSGWSAQEGTTKATLLTALAKLQRQDVAQKLQSEESRSELGELDIV
uniref:tumor necrosis factor receptor superfamily member 16-like n=1 Tax=Myxine glutinosa TaxID=7769 RepID=UPI0035900D8A